MIQSLIIGIGLTVVMALAWVLIQTLWKDAFRDEYLEEDVLAGRRSCSNCGCTTVCSKKKAGGDHAKEKLYYRKLTEDQL